MELYLFRLMLNEREIRDLFEQISPARTIVTREQSIRSTFGVERKFKHYGSEFVYYPEVDEESKNFIFGWIGRERRIAERTPPEQGFEPTEHRGWQAAFIAVDPSAHQDGQKVAMEWNREIGEPKAILRSLINEINKDSTNKFYIQCYPILVEGSFWTFAKAHNEKIRSITFDVAVPNMFGGVSDFEQEMKFVHRELNGSRIKTLIESDTVLRHTDQRLKDIVDYVEKGAGELQAEAMDGEKYTSNSHEKHINIEIENHTKNTRAFWRELWQRIDRIFP